MCVCPCPRRPEKEVSSSEAGGCEPRDISVVNQTQVLCKDSERFTAELGLQRRLTIFDSL